MVRCKLCKPSDYWLGKFSAKPQIKNGKFWLSQHLDSIGLSDSDKRESFNSHRKYQEAQYIQKLQV
jgi:hypothetical protein